MAEKKSPHEPRGYAQLAGLGVELAGSVAGGSLLGYWIDRQFDTHPWALLIGSLIGIVGGMYNLVRKAVHESLSIGPRPRGTGGREGEEGVPGKLGDGDDEPPSPV